jgi:hypothetical protein
MDFGLRFPLRRPPIRQQQQDKPAVPKKYLGRSRVNSESSNLRDVLTNRGRSKGTEETETKKTDY